MEYTQTPMVSISTSFLTCASTYFGHYSQVNYIALEQAICAQYQLYDRNT
jgi:hypothetical protein